MADAQEDDEREEELNSIAAIFPELVRDSTNPFCASLDISVSPTKPLLIRFPPAVDGVPHITLPVATLPTGSAIQNQDEHALSHLPPLHLQVTLPSDYPEDKAPTVQLSATPAWLPREILDDLERRAVELWGEYGHMVMLFSYIDYIEQAAQQGFGLSENGRDALDVDQGMKIALLDFDITEKRNIFERETFDCDICIEPKKGKDCYRLQKCGHVFCKGCLQDFYHNAIAEGDIASVKCLKPDCGLKKEVGERRAKKPARTLGPNELLKIPLEESVVRRYIDLKRKKKYESDPTTTYCPREWCQGPARSQRTPKRTLTEIEDDESDSEPEAPATTAHELRTDLEASQDRLRICENCDFAFCRVCLASWHGEFVRCWPRDKSELTAEEQASYDYIRMNTSPCPTCTSPAQKIHGCNHMNCSICKTHFCYLCSSWLDPQNPYQHFNEPGKPCYQLLWELEEGENEAGDAQFRGARALEIAAIAAARAAAEEEAAAAQQPAAVAPVVQVVNPIVPPAPEPIVEAVAQVGLEDFEDDSSEDEWDPQPRVQFEPRPAGQPRRRPRRPALGGAGPNLRRGQLGMRWGNNNGAYVGGGAQERRELQQIGMGEFLRRHGHHDEPEDELDANETDEEGGPDHPIGDNAVVEDVEGLPMQQAQAQVRPPARI